MTDKGKKMAGRVTVVVAALPTLAAVLVWAGNTAFVSHAELRPVTQAVDSLRTNAAADRAAAREESQKLDRVLCYMQAQAGERPTSECVR